MNVSERYCRWLRFTVAYLPILPAPNANPPHKPWVGRANFYMARNRRKELFLEL